VLLSARGSVAKGLVQKEVQRASEIQPEWPVAIDRENDGIAAGKDADFFQSVSKQEGVFPQYRFR